MNIILFTKKDKTSVREVIRYLKNNFKSVSIYSGTPGDVFPTEAMNESCDLIISYLSPWIIPLDFLKKAKFRAINFHPGPPEYPGIGCFNFAIYNGEKTYGVIAHEMEAKVDTGRIIGIKRFPIKRSDSVYSLSMNSYKHMFSLFAETMDYILKNNKLPVCSEEWKRKPYLRKELEDLCKVGVNMTGKEITRRIKATAYPNMPGVYLDIGGYKFEYNPGQLWRIHRRKSRVIRDYKPVNILFLGGARRISLAERFIDAAERLKIEPSLFSYELSENVAISGLAKIIVGLKWNHKDILKHLSKVIDDLNINIVLPFVDPATVVAAKLKKKRKDIFIPVSDESICDIFFDKRKANAWFVKNGFPVPESSSSFPLIAKPYKGSATKHVMIMKNIEDLEFFKANFNQKKYLVQRFIEGTEYTIDSYISVFGQTLSVVPRKRIEIMAGEVTKSITERELRIITLVE